MRIKRSILGNETVSIWALIGLMWVLIVGRGADNDFGMNMKKNKRICTAK